MSGEQIRLLGNSEFISTSVVKDNMDIKDGFELVTLTGNDSEPLIFETAGNQFVTDTVDISALESDSIVSGQTGVSDLTELQDVDYDSVMALTEEEISSMTGEELAELFHNAMLNALMDDFENGTSSNMNKIMQNSLLFSLVNKMSDAQLESFMDAYKEMYPQTKDGNNLDFYSYEQLENGVMWGMYAVDAGLISKDDAMSALQRLKSYFPDLIPDTYDTRGVKQWL